MVSKAIKVQVVSCLIQSKCTMELNLEPDLLSVSMLISPALAVVVVELKVWAVTNTQHQPLKLLTQWLKGCLDSRPSRYEFLSFGFLSVVVVGYRFSCLHSLHHS